MFVPICEEGGAPCGAFELDSGNASWDPGVKGSAAGGLENAGGPADVPAAVNGDCPIFPNGSPLLDA